MDSEIEPQAARMSIARPARRMLIAVPCAASTKEKDAHHKMYIKIYINILLYI